MVVDNTVATGLLQKAVVTLECRRPPLSLADQGGVRAFRRAARRGHDPGTISGFDVGDLRKAGGSVGGGIPGPFESWLALGAGLKDLMALRAAHQSGAPSAGSPAASELAIRRVRSVHYPGH